MGSIGKTRGAILVAAAMATALGGCSTRPRNFAATVSAPVADRVTFEQDYRTCESLVRAGHKGGFKSAALQTAATGVGALGTGAGLVATGTVGITSSTGAAAAATAAMPVIGLLLGFGVSRAIRGGKERKFKRNMATCLNEYGYKVVDWEKLKKRDDAAAFASRQAQVASPAMAEQEIVEGAITVEEVDQPVATTPATVALVTPED